MGLFYRWCIPKVSFENADFMYQFRVSFPQALKILRSLQDPIMQVEVIHRAMLLVGRRVS